MTMYNAQVDTYKLASALFDEGKYEAAFSKYIELAQAGSIHAQLIVGWMYHSGRGVKQDIDEALRWYKEAAVNNSPEAQFYLGTVYRSKQQYQEAIDWLQRAATAGYMPALYRLGKMYDFGEGVNRDERKALEYLEQAARMGHLFARREVAVKMIKGRHGIMNIFRGLYIFMLVLYDSAKLASKDPDSDMLRR